MPPKACLPEDVNESASRHIAVAMAGDRHQAGLDWVLILSMIAPYAYEILPIGFN
jgi:hypothetical protein